MHVEKLLQKIKIFNNLIYDNFGALNGGGLWVSGGGMNIEMQNNTFYNNTCYDPLLGNVIINQFYSQEKCATFTATPTDTPTIPTRTPTPTPSINPCNGTAIDITIIVTGTTTTTSTTTTTTTSRDVGVSGETTYTISEPTVICPSETYELEDCVNGVFYYVYSEPVFSTIALPVGTVFKAYVNNTLTCVTFSGLSSTSPNAYLGNITQVFGTDCDSCTA